MKLPFEVHVSLRGQPEWINAVSKSTGWKASVMNKDDQFLTKYYASYDEAKDGLLAMKTALRSGYSGNYLGGEIKQFLFSDFGESSAS